MGIINEYFKNYELNYGIGVVYNLIQVVQMLAYLLAEMLDGLFNWGDNLL
jgi:hypothetical protein